MIFICWMFYCYNLSRDCKKITRKKGSRVIDFCTWERLKIRKKRLKEKKREKNVEKNIPHRILIVYSIVLYAYVISVCLYIQSPGPRQQLKWSWLDITVQLMIFGCRLRTPLYVYTFVYSVIHLYPSSILLILFSQFYPVLPPGP